MRNLSIALLTILFGSILLSTSCNKDEDFEPDNSSTTDTTSNNPPTDTTYLPPIDTISPPPVDTVNNPNDTTQAQKETVDTVILSRYAGLWYEIATIPQIFQTGCNCTTAEYAPVNTNEISVINNCNLFSANGFENRIEGSATIVPNSGNAKLMVSFFGFGGADYWIIDLDEDYQWAVVGSPNKQTFWILSRTRILDQTLYNDLLQKWGDRGYDITKVEKTNQSGC